MLERILADNGFPSPVAESGGCRVFQFHSETGEGIMTQYDLFPGVYLMYNDFHMESYNSVFRTMEDMLCIDYCRQGRMEYPAGPDTYSYVEAGDLKLDRRLEHQGHFTFPLAHYHGITIGFTLPLAVQSLKEWVWEFPVDLVRLQAKFCAGRHPRVIHGAPSVDHIFQELYAVPEQIKLPYFRIKVLELLLYLDALELDGRTEKPYFYKSQVEKVKAAHRLLTEDLERHYTIAELSERFSIPATALKECFKSVYGQPVNTRLAVDRLEALLQGCGWDGETL